MPVLDCPIPKKDWLHEIGAHNGVCTPLAVAAPEKLTADAGAWELAVTKILGFQHLGDGWDGLAAVAPSRDLLQSAVGLAYVFREKGVAPPNGVLPGLDGSVNLEWQEPDGTIVEVEIDRPLHAEVMVIEPGQPPRFWDLPSA